MSRLVLLVLLSWALTVACSDDLPVAVTQPAGIPEEEVRRIVREEVQRALAAQTPAPDPDCDVATAAARALPSVVRIEVRDPRTGDLTGLGTGFVALAGGIVMTAAHVTGTSPRVDVIAADGRRFAAEVLRADPMRDVAVLRIPDRRLPAMRWADTATLTLGEPVRVVGFPYGRPDVSVTGGVLAGRSVSPERSRQELFTDAGADPGDSGGPLLTACGEALGVVSGRQTGSSSITVVVGGDTALPLALEAAKSP